MTSGPLHMPTVPAGHGVAPATGAGPAAATAGSAFAAGSAAGCGGADADRPAGIGVGAGSGSEIGGFGGGAAIAIGFAESGVAAGGASGCGSGAESGGSAGDGPAGGMPAGSGAASGVRVRLAANASGPGAGSAGTGVFLTSAPGAMSEGAVAAGSAVAGVPTQARSCTAWSTAAQPTSQIRASAIVAERATAMYDMVLPPSRRGDYRLSSGRQTRRVNPAEAARLVAEREGSAAPARRLASMHQQQRQGHAGQRGAGRAAEQLLAPRRVAVAAHDQQVRRGFPRRIEQDPADLPPGAGRQRAEFGIDVVPTEVIDRQSAALRIRLAGDQQY